MNDRDKRKEFIDVCLKQLVELTTHYDKKLTNKLKHIIQKIMNETLDFENAMKYIHYNMGFAKKPQDKAFWAKVTQIIKEYFETIK
jgi:hypothetical protein